MNRDFADNLILSLRSGNYEQSTGCLYDGIGHCCLGVAYETAGYRPTFKPESNDAAKDHWFYEDHSSAVLSDNFRKQIGMAHETGQIVFRFEDQNITVPYCSLASLNDEGFTFNQIADVIDYFCDIL